VKLKQAGAVIMPASPGFYNKPKTIDDLVDNVVGRILDQLGIDNDVYLRWGEKQKSTTCCPRRPIRSGRTIHSFSICCRILACTEKQSLMYPRANNGY